MTAAAHLKDQAIQMSENLLIAVPFCNDVMTLHHAEQLASKLTAAVLTAADTGAQGADFT
jgi:hypothetical protein